MPELDDAAARVARLEQQLADLRARLPAHSIPPSMIAELDALEEALALARNQWQAEQGANPSRKFNDFQEGRTQEA
jgi:hypothetical protein